ncbi:hypothetical protein CONLIGDRAFT_7227 [Coniochaeta ligniaria NRRL 30616]|uniref:Secondary alcohol dehydrogenase n=1 Tax=Coniochaeta ligniaria NRRL 30616 TaxID=1408157 RepID=A0A1J7J551_9PEZI|nr:hypothetical protein CONLIGDRAFT_7227 [Coniochaeta ligniaria NRRL 30616]
MSTDAPISPTRFAAALKDLSLSMLHLKVLELRNSIAHLDYSNEQLRPFADGTEPTLSSPSSPPQPDQDCVDAIRENEDVIRRMQERIALVRAEVEERGCSWTEFQSKEEVEEEERRRREERGGAALVNGTGGGEAVNGEGGRAQHSAWTDGTFQTGTISNGEVRMDAVPEQETTGGGGSLTDEELRRRVEEQLRSLDDDEEEGMHL